MFVRGGPSRVGRGVSAAGKSTSSSEASGPHSKLWGKKLTRGREQIRIGGTSPEGPCGVEGGRKKRILSEASGRGGDSKVSKLCNEAFKLEPSARRGGALGGASKGSRDWLRGRVPRFKKIS